MSEERSFQYFLNKIVDSWQNICFNTSIFSYIQEIV